MIGPSLFKLQKIGVAIIKKRKEDFGIERRRKSAECEGVENKEGRSSEPV